MAYNYRLKRRVTKLLEAVFFCIILTALLSFFLFTFAWMIMSSFKTNVQITAYPPQWIFSPTFGNYIAVFTENPFLDYIWNSTVIALASVSLGLFFGLPAAYSMARYKQVGLGFVILFVRILPGIVFLVPLFIIYRRLGLINTHAGIVATHVTLVLPMVIWIMAGFFEDIPSELVDAALIDGCSLIGSFFRIILPLSMPGIVAVVILSFIASWNNFIFVLILGGAKTTTVPMAVYNFMSFEDVNWGGLTAAATIITMPIIILSLLVQKQLAKGLTLGAVKG